MSNTTSKVSDRVVKGNIKFKMGDRVVYSQAELFHNGFLGKHGEVIGVTKDGRVCISFDGSLLSEVVEASALEREQKN